jgi:hypothetical protein
VDRRTKEGRDQHRPGPDDSARIYDGKRLKALLAGWSTLGFSVVLGLIECVSQLAESHVTPRRTRLEVLSLFQWSAFLTGIILFGLFAATNVAASR